MDAIEGERLTMARDLHDTVVQDFIVIITQLRRALDRSEAPDRLRHTLESFSAAEEGLTRARGLLRKLRGKAGYRWEGSNRPPAVRLSDALNRAMDRVVRHSPLQVQVRCADSVMLPAKVAGEILCIVSEAACNVVRHARASRITCTVDCVRDALVVQVRDDGVGFLAKHRASGFGVEGMYERAQLIGASLSIHPEPGQGVAVLLTVPMAGWDDV